MRTLLVFLLASAVTGYVSYNFGYSSGLTASPEYASLERQRDAETEKFLAELDAELNTPPSRLSGGAELPSDFYTACESLFISVPASTLPSWHCHELLDLAEDWLVDGHNARSEDLQGYQRQRWD